MCHISDEVDGFSHPTWHVGNFGDVFSSIVNLLRVDLEFRLSRIGFPPYLQGKMPQNHGQVGDIIKFDYSVLRRSVGGFFLVKFTSSAGVA